MFQSETENAADTNVRLQLLALAVGQGVLSGHVLANRYLSAQPLALLTPLIIAAGFPVSYCPCRAGIVPQPSSVFVPSCPPQLSLFPPSVVPIPFPVVPSEPPVVPQPSDLIDVFQSISKSVGASRISLLSASLSAAFGVNFALGLISGYLTGHYLLLSLLYTASAGVVLQLVFKNIQTPEQRTHVYQLALLSSFVLSKAAVAGLFGYSDAYYAQSHSSAAVPSHYEQAPQAAQ